MGQGHGLGQVLVQAERAAERAGDLAHLQRVREAIPPVVLLAREHAGGRLLPEPAEGTAVEDAVTVALEGRAVVEAPTSILQREAAGGRRGAHRAGPQKRFLGALEPTTRRGSHARILAKFDPAARGP